MYTRLLRAVICRRVITGSISLLTRRRQEYRRQQQRPTPRRESGVGTLRVPIQPEPRTFISRSRVLVRVATGNTMPVDASLFKIASSPTNPSVPSWLIPAPDEFDPDRFLDERLKKYLLTNAFQFLPFNAGPRICLGQQFAYNEMSFVLIRLLQSFSAFHLDEAAFAPASRPPAEWKNAKGRKAVDRFRPRMHLTMSTLGGMWVRVTEAGEEV